MGATGFGSGVVACSFGVGVTCIGGIGVGCIGDTGVGTSVAAWGCDEDATCLVGAKVGSIVTDGGCGADTCVEIGAGFVSDTGIEPSVGTSFDGGGVMSGTVVEIGAGVLSEFGGAGGFAAGSACVGPGVGTETVDLRLSVTSFPQKLNAESWAAITTVSTSSGTATPESELVKGCSSTWGRAKIFVPSTISPACTTKASAYLSHPASVDDTVTVKVHVNSTADWYAEANSPPAHPSLAWTWWKERLKHRKNILEN